MGCLSGNKIQPSSEMAPISAPKDDSATNILTDEELPPSNTTTVVEPTGSEHTHTIIFLHGREVFGSFMAKDFLDDKSSDGRTLAETFPSIRWVFPTAKIRYSAKRDHEFGISSFATALKGEECISQWFDVWDIRDPEIRKELVAPGLQESIRDIMGIIREEAQRVSRERIVLGGLSQGCATAIFALLSSGMDLGGFIGWCGWLPFQRSIEDLPNKCIGDKREISRRIQTILQHPDEDNTSSEQIIPALNEITHGPGVGIAISSRAVGFNSLNVILSNLFPGTQPVIKTPVFLAHSRDDEIVPFRLGDDLHQIMKRLGFDVTWKKYEDGGHWINPDHGVDDMSTFLKRVMNI